MDEDMKKALKVALDIINSSDYFWLRPTEAEQYSLNLVVNVIEDILESEGTK